MVGSIIWYVVCFGCAILFYSIGMYSQKLKTPMHFWAGSKVDAEQITDIKGYNHENARMWKLYSLWYVAAGLAEIWDTYLAMLLLFGSCTLGLWFFTSPCER